MSGWRAESLSAEQHATRDHRPSGKFVQPGPGGRGGHVRPLHSQN